MAGTYRLTSVSSSSVAHPTFRVSHVSATSDGVPPQFRLTLISAEAGASTSAVFRLTEISLTNVVNSPAPIGDAGSDIRAASAETWTLNGTDSIESGAIASRQWTQLTKTAGAPDLVLDDATLASPTFTAPVLQDDVEYLFGYVVTSDQGVQSTQSTATVYVAGADLYLATGSGWSPMGLLVATTNDGWI